MLQYVNQGCIRYAYTSLVTMGSEDRSVHDEGWIEDQHTGNRHVIAFSLLPIEVVFDGQAPVVLAPPTTAMTRPMGEYTRIPMNGRGQRTVFVSIDTATAREIAGFYEAAAVDRDDPFPARSGPSSTTAIALAMQLERVAFDKNNPVDSLMFEDISLQIVGNTLETFYQSRGYRQKSQTALTCRKQREQVDHAIVLMCNSPSQRWSLAELAKNTSLSPTYLSRIFKRHAGKNLSKCLQLIRVTYALERLSDCRGNLTRLALDCGFASHAHMTSTFQNLVGASPSQLAGQASRATSEMIKAIRGRLKQ